ncbi:MAG: MBL fold metallo-hydrolase [Deltaproteobacteria bacterium]|nr:MBL fold metallo-hydrolase [Deltaproteobacteria bacterium]
MKRPHPPAAPIARDADRAAGAPSTTPGGAPDPAKTREVAPGVFEVFLPLPAKPTIINVWLLDCGGPWALIDTGVARAESRDAFAGALASLGVAPSQLTHLLATHHHPDHFGASRALRAETGARVHIHPAELERIDYTLHAGPEDMVRHSRRNGIPIPTQPVDAPKPMDFWAATFQPATEADHLLVDGEVLEIGSRRLQVVWTPGHTPGHCCFLDLEDRVLFVGDHLLPRITPHVGVYATGPENPLGDFLASQEKVATLDARLVCPAHGGVYEDHRHRARQLIRHHEARAGEMHDVLRAGPATAYDVARRVFRWVFENPNDRFQAGAAVMETIAHLEMLRERGVLRREERDGVLLYLAA